jgi:predicted ribosome quality control (RQC) complex YloA/Tae2 family protein
VYDNNGIELCVIPFEIEIFKENKKKFFKSFNEAVDEFYSKLDSEELIIPHDLKIKEKIKAQKKILQNQLNYLMELDLRKKKYYKYGDFIYANFEPLENLINVILNARSKGYTWEQIHEKLEGAKNENIHGTEYFKKLIPATQQLIINVENEEISLDLQKSLGENANLIYSKGKKADKKIKGTLPAIEQTKEKITNLKLEKESLELKMDFLIKKPKKKWFEKFRWFNSSDGFLIIAGRDSTSNEIIFKKYIEPNDLVFHTDFSGSPLTILKNPENKQIPEKTIHEAADFTASFSKAWKENWGVVEVFYVSPNQISKSPPSGEYLPKGSFMIFGKKNFIKNAKTELVISLKMVKVEMDNIEKSDVFYPTILYGPKSVIEANTTDKYIIIKPSKSGVSSGNLAKEIKQFFLKTSDLNIKKYVELLTIEEINLCLPPGNSIVSSSN